ncbi:MAG: DegT/DnrJ/EryC1/StrS family aminotransferase [Planctomycetota bacterium]
MKIKFTVPQFKPYTSVKIIEKIKKILKKGILVNGEYTQKLSRELEKKFRGRKALIVDSGTSALVLVLRILQTENKSVLIPSYICSALLHACLIVGAKPVLYDIEYPDLYFNVKKLKENAPENLSAVIVPHLFGRAVNIEEFIKAFGENLVIEDCATSFGISRKNIPCGMWSCFSVFSFGPTKYISSIKGGALLVKNVNDFENASDIYYYDKKSSYTLRYNFLSNEISNLISLYQIKYSHHILKKRKEKYNYYLSRLNNALQYLPGRENENNFYKFIILSPDKQIIKKRLYKNKIEGSDPVFIPIHRILGLDKKNYPGSEEFFKNALSLPLYPSITKKEQDKVIDALV